MTCCPIGHRVVTTNDCDSHSCVLSSFGISTGERIAKVVKEINGSLRDYFRSK